MAKRLRGALAMRDGLQEKLFDAAARRELTEQLDIDLDQAWESPDDIDRDVDVLVTGWASPFISEEVLARLPSLQLIAHSAGTVRNTVCDAVFDRGIRVTTAADANAQPVAEYTLAMILLVGKMVPFIARDYPSDGVLKLVGKYSEIGLTDQTVGLIGASRIGRLVIKYLQPFNINVVVYDPYLSAAEAAVLGVSKVALPELLSTSQIVSIHAPDIPETKNMVGREQLALMRDGATLINTARPALLDQDALQEEVLSGRLQAVLDVTSPEPLPTGHPLLGLPNAIVTPHIAGSMGKEIRLLGRAAAAEVRAFAEGRPAHSPVTREMLRNMA